MGKSVSDDDSPEWWTPREVASHLRVSEDTIQRQCATGNIQALKIGRQYRIHRSVIEAFKPKLGGQGVGRPDPMAGVKAMRRQRRFEATQKRYF